MLNLKNIFLLLYIFLLSHTYNFMSQTRERSASRPRSVEAILKSPRGLSSAEKQKLKDVLNDPSSGIPKWQVKEKLYGTGHGMNKEQIDTRRGGKDTQQQFADRPKAYKDEMKKNCADWKGRGNFGDPDPDCRWVKGGADSGRKDRRTRLQKQLGFSRKSARRSYSKRARN